MSESIRPCEKKLRPGQQPNDFSCCITCWDGDVVDIIADKLLILVDTANFISHYYIVKHTETEHVHFHVCIQNLKQKRKSYIINWFAEGLGLDPSQVSVQGVISLSAVLTYYLHIGYKDKVLYPLSAMISDISLDTIQDLIDCGDNKFTALRLIQFIQMYPHDDDLMLAMGLPMFHKYRSEIKILREIEMGVKMRHPINTEEGKDLPDSLLPF